MAVRFRILLIFLVLTSNLLRAETPTVDDVLQHFVTALGGREELEKINTMFFRGTLEIPSLKLNGTTMEYFKSPDHFAAVSDIVGYGTTKVVYDGHEAWQSAPNAAASQLSGPALADMQRRAHIHWNLKLHEFYPNLQLKGRETVGDEDAWKLEATVETWTYDLFFSVKSGLLVRFDTDQHTPDGQSSVLISDYRPVGKVLFAFGAAQTGGGTNWSRKLTEVKFNDPVDDSVFLKPKS
ncbi:MAG TPA: hypothetical protein VFO39_11895 [Candidatus Sulfotelmatobacter sp.]|nr:hypothetical protein [Candidatus Sulfotelmatobacter sp.]